MDAPPLDLQKSTASLRQSLERKGIHRMPQLDMACALDVSGSFEDEHADGITSLLLGRLVPWGLTFDPDQKIDVLTFSSGALSAHRVGALTENNYLDYVRNHVYAKVPGWKGDTEYSYVLERALEEFGWTAGPKKTGFLGRMMGRGSTPAKERRGSLIIFITDGDNEDKERTREVLRASEERRDEVYFLFLGVANGGGRFEFLDSIGEEFGNTGFREISNIRTFIAKTDDEINEFLLDDELIGWLRR